jgi:hypothetical protein
MGGEIVLLTQQHLQSPSRRVARDTGAVDAAANDQQVAYGRGDDV